MWVPSPAMVSLPVVAVGTGKKGIFCFTCKETKIFSLHTSHQVVLLIAEVTKNVGCQSEPSAPRTTFLCVQFPRVAGLGIRRDLLPVFCCFTVVARAFCWALVCLPHAASLCLGTPVAEVGRAFSRAPSSRQLESVKQPFPSQ